MDMNLRLKPNIELLGIKKSGSTQIFELCSGSNDRSCTLTCQRRDEGPVLSQTIYGDILQLRIPKARLLKSKSPV
jgi:hypothetical protein